MKLKISLIILLIICLFASCTKEFGGNCSEGAGQIEKRELDLESLTKIDLGLSGQVFVSEGPQFIEIEAPSDIIDRILDESTIESERWIIEIDGCYDGPELKVWITLPQFIALDISGSGDIIGLDTLKNINQLNLEIDGSGNINLTILDAQKIDTEIKGSGDIAVHGKIIETLSCDIQGSGNILVGYNSGLSSRSKIEGSGNIELVGNVEDSFVDIEGSGNVFAFGLCTDNCTIDSQGNGNCEVKVSNRLDINLEGSGNICYRGQPIINSDIDGSGNVRSCN